MSKIKVNKKVFRRYCKIRSLTEEEGEREIFEILSKVSVALSYKYTFGYHTHKDIEQDAFIIGMEKLSLSDREKGSYDPTRPLENFLYVHIAHRLSNNIRKDYYRNEAPCTCCSPETPHPCRRWLTWQKNNKSKKNIMNPVDVSSLSHEDDPSMANDLDISSSLHMKELLRKIDEELPVELRADYLRLREGVPLPKLRRERIRAVLTEILDQDPPEMEGDEGWPTRKS